MNKMPSNQVTNAEGLRHEAARESSTRADVLRDFGLDRLPPLLRPSKLAELLDMKRQRIYEMVEAGTLDGVRIGPRGLRVSRASVARWLSERRVI